MKHFDQATLDKLVKMNDEEPSTIQLTITTYCVHSRFEDIDGVQCCGLSGGYDTCKCELGVLCGDFEPDKEDFDQFLRDVLEDL